MRTIEATTLPKTAAQNMGSYWDAVVSAELRKGEDPLDESGPSIEIVAADKVRLDGARNKARQIIDSWQKIIDETTEVKGISN